jgi:hypothetical protein
MSGRRRLGARAGVADLILVHRGRAFALELKADDGRPTVEQMAFVSDLLLVAKLLSFAA